MLSPFPRSPTVQSYAFSSFPSCFFFNDTSTTEIYTLSLHDALPISSTVALASSVARYTDQTSGVPEWPSLLMPPASRSEEHTSELQSHSDLVCRLLLEKKKKSQSRRR